MKTILLFIAASLVMITSAKAANQCHLVFGKNVVDLTRAELVEHSAVYPSAEKAFESKFQALKEAKHSILISTFSIKPDAWYARDPVGKTLADILIQKRREGVEVKVFTDYWGNPPSTRAEVKRMIKEGVDVRFFGAPKSFFDLLVTLWRGLRDRNLSNLNHGKTMVVDGWHAYTGGYNWMLGKTKDIEAWRDTDIGISGPIAKKVAEDFYALFEQLPKRTKNEDQARTDFIYSKKASIYRDEFFTQAPWLTNGQTPINDKILRMINDSRQGDHIFWQSFSFRVQPTHLLALRRAAKRGVKISVVTNSQENLYKQMFFLVVPFTRRMVSNALYKQGTESYPPLLHLSEKTPVNLYEFHGDKGPLHAKAFLLLRAKTVQQLERGEEPTIFLGEGGVGTYNVSPNSWERHIETMMFTNRPQVIKELWDVYQSDIAVSKEVPRDWSM